jgi:hypothetical protein
VANQAVDDRRGDWRLPRTLSRGSGTRSAAAIASARVHQCRSPGAPDGFRWLDRPAGPSGILGRRMALRHPRFLEIEILSEAERKTFAGGEPYQHRREGSIDRQREEALLELVSTRALVDAASYPRATDPDPEFPLKFLAREALGKILDFSRTIIPLKITQRGRLRLARLYGEMLSGRDRLRDEFNVLWAHRYWLPDLAVQLRKREPGSPISLLRWTSTTSRR